MLTKKPLKIVTPDYNSEDGEDSNEIKSKSKKLSKLENFAFLPNIAEELDDDDLLEIGRKLYEGFEEDVATRIEWGEMIDKSLKLASLTPEEKDWPWEHASNLKYPAITNAAIQFAAYTYPEIVRNDKAVEVQVVGFDENGEKAERASRLTKYLNYKLLCASGDWERNLDTLLHMLPTQGVVYKKIFYDPTKQKNISLLCGYKEVYVNNNIRCLKEARRITHKMVKHKNDLITKIREGLFSEIELSAGTESDRHPTVYTEMLEDNEYEVLEIHCYLDLDDDDYEEPYIVTLLSETQQILRIVARYNPEDIKKNKKGEVYYIEPTHYFVDYHYIPSFDGKYHSQSVASLLFAYNKGINAVMNQLINAGTLSTTQAGFLGRGARIRGGRVDIAPGKWIKTDSASGDDLAKNIMPLDFKDPSPVLFQLLGFLVDSAKEAANITDVMTGKQNPSAVQSGTIQLLAEKGLKVFSAIQRRFYSSLEQEFEMLFELDRKYTTEEEYRKVLDYPGEFSKDQDFNKYDYDVRPVANPNLASDMQRMLRSQQEMMLITEGGPLVGNQDATLYILTDYLEALNSTHIEAKVAAFKQQSQQPAPPNPDAIKIQADMQTEAEKLRQSQDKLDHKKQMDSAKMQLDYQAQQADIEVKKANAMKLMAEAQVIGNEQQFNQAQMQLEALLKSQDIHIRQTDQQLKVNDQNIKQQQVVSDAAKHSNQLTAGILDTQLKARHQASLEHAKMQNTNTQNAVQRQHENNQNQQQFQQNVASQQLDHAHQNQQNIVNKSVDYAKHKETLNHARDLQQQQLQANARDNRDVASSSGNSSPDGSSQTP